MALRLSPTDRARLEAPVARWRDDAAAAIDSWPAAPLLPVPLTSFIGREQILALVQQTLATSRLLTLTGAGGTGKTRLALQIATQLRDDGETVLFVPLAPLHDATLVLPTIARVAGLADGSEWAFADRLRQFVGTRALSMVLDNCEHLLPAGPGIAALVSACPHLRVLVTSRTALGVSGEQQLPVPPLALPDAARRLPVAALAQQEAVRLFLERARAVQPDFVLDEANAAAVAAICCRLDDLPLAIELAAGWMKLLPPQSLLRRLGRRLPLLVGGAQDLPVRQRTLRATIDWSYNLLTPRNSGCSGVLPSSSAAMPERATPCCPFWRRCRTTTWRSGWRRRPAATRQRRGSRCWRRSANTPSSS